MVPQMETSKIASAIEQNGHFSVSKKAAEHLGVQVLNVLQHVVLIKTNKGPRFISRKRWFDQWEWAQRRSRARGCIAQPNGQNSWLVFDPHTDSDHHIVTLTAMNTKVHGFYQCTCADAHFQAERGIPRDEIKCKHILAVSMWESKAPVQF